jgi:hypothetical protein
MPLQSCCANVHLPQTFKIEIMKPLFLSLLLFATMVAGAQEISNQVVSNAGGEFNNSGISMSWTLGEGVIETFSSDEFVLTQGFQQSTFTVTRIDEIVSDLFSVEVFPNPVTDYLNISFSGEVNDAQLSLYDINGKLIMEQPINESESTVNLSDLPEATYFLKLISSNGKESANFKIVKNR